tara:strand:+ start:1842 stop:2252 length:411 start_codon:yes stop_codon:yes gene_type:complete
MYSPAQQGFGRIVSQGGANVLGGLSGRSLGREANLAGAALAGKSAMNAAEARGKAIRYQGRQQGRDAMFGGLLSGLTSIAGGAISSGMFSGGGGGDAASILSNPNIPDMGYNIDLKFKNPMSYSAYSNPGNLFGGF